MNFARCFAFVSWAAVSLVCGVACSSASTGLFSETNGGSSAAGSSAASAGATSSVAGAGGHPSTAGAAGSTAEAGGGTGGGADDAAGASNGTSGSSEGGSGGVSAGGSPSGGTAGEMAGSGGVNAGSGGSAVGGAGANGGSGNTGGDGAAGNAGCPATAPVQGKACTVSTPDSCFYTGVSCSCQAPGPFQSSQANKKWACYGTPDKCADPAPMSATSCKTNGGANCPYPDNVFCTCMGGGGDPKWSCQLPGSSCPATKPLNGVLCGPIRACSYPDDACFCNGTVWGCESG